MMTPREIQNFKRLQKSLTDFTTTEIAAAIPLSNAIRSGVVLKLIASITCDDELRWIEHAAALKREGVSHMADILDPDEVALLGVCRS